MAKSGNESESESAKDKRNGRSQGRRKRPQAVGARRRNATLGVENLEHRLLLASDWQNPGNRFDVDNNLSTQFEVAPLDANIVITELNERTISDPILGTLPAIGATDPAPENFIDVTGDMLLTPLDAIQVINQLNIDFTNVSQESFVATTEFAMGTEGNDALVNDVPVAGVNSPAVANGGDQSVVVWEQFSEADNAWGIFAQRYDENGAVIGEAIEVEAGTSLSQRFPAVAVNSIGSFAVVWQSETAEGGSSISAQTFTSAGVVVAETFQVNQADGNQFNPDVAFATDGLLAVTWEGDGAGDFNGIFAREFFLTGPAVDDAMLVNTDTTGRQSSPAIAAVSDDTFIVVWDGPNPDTTDGAGANAIFARIGEAGVQILDEGDGLADPAVSVAPDGSWVVTYSAGNTILAQQMIPTDSTLDLSLTGLESLGDAFNYEAWAVVDGEPVALGVFDIDENGDLIGTDGTAPTFLVDPNATEIVISIEPENDPDPGPANTTVLGGVIDANGQVVLTIDSPSALNTDFSTASGVFLIATPTTTATDDESSGVWFLNNQGAEPVAGLELPVLPSGWTYEGWAVIDGQPVSTGRFDTPDGPDDFSGHSGPEPAPPFPGEDFLVDPPSGLTFPAQLLPVDGQDGATIVISVEPVPDNSTDPFPLRPLVAQVPDTLDPGVNSPLAAGDIGVSGTATITPNSTPLLFTVADDVELVSSAIDHAADGSFAVSYVDENGLIRIQQFDANADPVGDAFVANQTTFTIPVGTAIAATDSDFLTVWQARADTDTTGVFARST